MFPAFLLSSVDSQTDKRCASYALLTPPKSTECCELLREHLAGGRTEETAPAPGGCHLVRPASGGIIEREKRGVYHAHTCPRAPPKAPTNIPRLWFSKLWG